MSNFRYSKNSIFNKNNKFEAALNKTVRFTNSLFVKAMKDGDKQTWQVFF